MREPIARKLRCAVTGVEVDGTSLLIRFSALRGHPPEIVDRIRFGPERDVDVVQGVGRFLRVLRAARIRPPDDPYRLLPEQAAELVTRCFGSQVELSLRKRYERALTLWTESGVERFSEVVDFHEERDALVVRRRGGQSPLRVPRHTLIRYEAASAEFFDVVAVTP